MIQKKVDEKNNITYLDYNTAYVDDSVIIGRNVTIDPNVTLVGKTKIGDGTTLKNGVVVIDSEIGKDCYIGQNVMVRKNSIIGDKVLLGKGVEIKQSTIGNNTGIYHLNFIGDSIIGQNVLIGAGTVTANNSFIDENKVTVIEDGAKVGANVTIIPPLTIGKNAWIGAGAIINKDIPSNHVAFSKNTIIIREMKGDK